MWWSLVLLFRGAVFLLLLWVELFSPSPLLVAATWPPPSLGGVAFFSLLWVVLVPRRKKHQPKGRRRRRNAAPPDRREGKGGEETKRVGKNNTTRNRRRPNSTTQKKRGRTQHHPTKEKRKSSPASPSPPLLVIISHISMWRWTSVPGPDGHSCRVSMVALVVDSGIGMCQVVLPVCSSSCVPLCSLQTHDARRHGYEPEGILRGEVLDVPVVWTCRFSGAAVEKTLALPQLQLVENSPLVVADCRKLRIFRGCSSSRSLSSCRDAEAYPHGPSDHRDSPMLFDMVLSASLSWRRGFSMVQTVADHRDFYLLVDKVVDAPVVRVMQVLRCCRGEDLGAPTVAARWEIRLFLRPFVFGSHLFGVRLRCTGLWTLLGGDFWMFPVFSAIWFNSGYMLRQFTGAFGIFPHFRPS